MREIIYCEDCPILRLCKDEGRDCEYTRYIHKVASEAPPLTHEQIKHVAAILRSAAPREQPAGDRNQHREAGPFKCQVPDCDAAPLKHRGSLWQHLRINHQMKMDEYRQRYGEPTPLTADELAELVIEVKCEVEGCSTVYSTANGNRWPRSALNSHLRGRHGLKPDYTPVRTESS